MGDSHGSKDVDMSQAYRWVADMVLKMPTCQGSMGDRHGYEDVNMSQAYRWATVMGHNFKDVDMPGLSMGDSHGSKDVT